MAEWWGLGEGERGEEEFNASPMSKAKRAFDLVALEPQGSPRHVTYQVPSSNSKPTLEVSGPSRMGPGRAGGWKPTLHSFDLFFWGPKRGPSCSTHLQPIFTTPYLWVKSGVGKE